MDIDIVFEGKLKQLESLIKNTDIYNSIEIAGIVRDLLLSDQNGLVGELLRHHPELRTKRSRRLEFSVEHTGSSEAMPGTGRAFLNIPPGQQSNFCTHVPLEGIQIYTRDKFLALPVLCIQDDHYSYKDIISFVANKLGARHFDLTSGSDKQMLLHEIRNTFGIDNFDPILTGLRDRSAVVASTCRRLYEMIHKD